LKRTRRIEVIRYTRRVTVLHRGEAPADANEVLAIDLTPDAREVAPPAPHEKERRPAAGDVAEPKAPVRRQAFRLRDLLRLRRWRSKTKGIGENHET
jgi:hypothetical protein